MNGHCSPERRAARDARLIAAPGAPTDFDAVDAVDRDAGGRLEPAQLQQPPVTEVPRRLPLEREVDRDRRAGGCVEPADVRDEAQRAGDLLFGERRRLPEQLLAVGIGRLAGERICRTSNSIAVVVPSDAVPADLRGVEPAVRPGDHEDRIAVDRSRRPRPRREHADLVRPHPPPLEISYSTQRSIVVEPAEQRNTRSACLRGRRR